MANDPLVELDQRLLTHLFSWQLSSLHHTPHGPVGHLASMSAWEAAVFLSQPYASFKEIASSLPRHTITPTRFGYLRRELLEHFRGP